MHCGEIALTGQDLLAQVHHVLSRGMWRRKGGGKEEKLEKMRNYGIVWVNIGWESGVVVTRAGFNDHTTLRGQGLMISGPHRCAHVVHEHWMAAQQRIKKPGHVGGIVQIM
eukprot:CAMPEP_0173291520 /NCGR_PEP_ID=MMETSP1143-20121109/12205_1 /TAXON_ID=483371 /ORGANISM="non described non described, Strain CCMP2298" /LENGTH=110 /DNA_ID=CAMNT_0014230779 /DNA_START=385 /DNA_END=717 /DNA_ORIENTATION=-